MNDGRKIIIVIGGLAESLVNFRGPLLKVMVERGYRVVACAPSASASIKNSLVEIGVEYENIPFDRAGLNPLRDFSSFFMLFCLFLRLKPEFVLGYTIKPVIYGSLAARLAGVRAVYAIITGLGYAFIGGSFKRRVVGGIARFLYKVCLKDSNKVFFQNPDDMRLFLQLGLLRNTEQGVLINGSGVDVDSFAVTVLPNKISFLLIARFLKDKGIEEYFEAARIIKCKHPDVNFRIAGWLDENPACISREVLDFWVKDGLIENLGKLTDVRPAISDSSVYVLPSYREGTPRTVLEAMSMGRSIITTDAPGCRETVINNENGFLVPVKSVKELVIAMETFILEPELAKKMGRRSREIAEDKYDVHKVNKVIISNMGIDL